MDKTPTVMMVLIIVMIAGLAYAYLEYTAEEPLLETGVLLEGGI